VTRTPFVVVAVLAIASVLLIGQTQTLPIMGTWKLNAEKSKFTPGPGPKTQTLKWEPASHGYVFTTESVSVEGKPNRTVTRAAFDGKPYAVEGSATKSMRAARRIDDHTFEDSDTVNGKVRITRRVVVSPDGKTLTVTSKGTNAEGQPVHNVSVYEKQ
jgi:hypothetical protein